MGSKVIGGLINSISRLIHLVACQTMKSSKVKDIINVIHVLKLLKPVLDESLDCEINSDVLIKASEELDIAVNEVREFMEKQPQKMSKIRDVLRTASMVKKAQNYSMEICHILNKLLLLSFHSSLSTSVQHCMQELQCVDREITSELIEVALKDQRENIVPNLEDIIKIMESLGLTSAQELLTESIALEKERTKAELEKNTEEVSLISQTIALVTHIRYCMAKLEQFGFINGLPVPSYLRCPLSLKLMLDPVIVASGQTYEKSYIQKWLDNGLMICPKTCQALAHANLTPNFTVRELIANWCEDNNIRLCDSVQINKNPDTLLSSATTEAFRHRDGFHFSENRYLTSKSSVEYMSQSDKQHRDLLSKSSVEVMSQSEQQRSEISSGSGGEDSYLVNHQEMVISKVMSHGNVSAEQHIYSQPHSGSISSVISSTEISSRFDEKVCLSEVTQPLSSPSNKDQGIIRWLSLNQLRVSPNGHNISSRTRSLSTSVSDELTTASHVMELVEDLKSRSPEVQATAAAELRLLGKHNLENRVLIAKCGAITPLVSLLTSNVKKIQENAVTALLNLSINDNNKISIAEAGAVESLIHVLESGSAEAQQNSAATLFSLSVLEDYKVKIGRSGAIKSLVTLLGSGGIRGKKDAATALFNLSICHENKARIVKAGAVKYLVELMEPCTGMADKSVALLANLSMIPEGCLAIAQEGGIPLLVEIVETGSQNGKENAASALFQLCINGSKFSKLVLQEGAVPPLISLSQFGTPRAREKAQQILGHFRSQRDNKSQGKIIRM